MAVQSLVLEQVRAEAAQARNLLAQLALAQVAGQGRLPGDPIIDLSAEAGQSLEERYQDQLPVYGRTQARIEPEERVLAQLQKEVVAAEGAVAAAELELRAAQAALEKE